MDGSRIAQEDTDLRQVAGRERPGKTLKGETVITRCRWLPERILKCGGEILEKSGGNFFGAQLELEMKRFRLFFFFLRGREGREGKGREILNLKSHRSLSVFGC